MGDGADPTFIKAEAASRSESTKATGDDSSGGATGCWLSGSAAGASAGIGRGKSRARCQTRRSRIFAPSRCISLSPRAAAHQCARHAGLHCPLAREPYPMVVRRDLRLRKRRVALLVLHRLSMDEGRTAYGRSARIGCLGPMRRRQRSDHLALLESRHHASSRHARCVSTRHTECRRAVQLIASGIRPDERRSHSNERQA